MTLHLALAVVWIIATIVWALHEGPGWPGKPVGGAAWLANVCLGVAVFFLR